MQWKVSGLEAQRKKVSDEGESKEEWYRESEATESDGTILAIASQGIASWPKRTKGRKSLPRREWHDDNGNGDIDLHLHRADLY